ncbi:MAG: hypothetical protein HY381_01805 [Candidatus Chisholmbacteria bacterium]|nr:hypothetical protein [Candidatus Chisholmbacteria bacterium]
MVRNKDLFKRVIELRKQNLSYSELSKKLSVPKSTVAGWLQTQPWSTNITLELTKRLGKVNARRIVLMNKARRQQAVDRHNSYRKQAQEEFKQLKKDWLFIVGLSLYWGEGEKTNTGRVAVINSDPSLLKIIINFYRQSLKVPEEKLRAALFIYSDHNEKKMLNFWSEKLSLPEDQFIKTQVLPSRKSLTSRSLKYGVCSAYFSSTEMSVKIQEWIRLLGNELRE